MSDAENRATPRQHDFARRLDAPLRRNASREEASQRIEESKYNVFTGPARVEKNMRMLEGILKGIAVDGVIRPGEAEAVNAWCQRHSDIAHREPFKQVVEALKSAMSDGVLTDEERTDLLWMCKQVETDEGGYFSAITADLQRLHGMLGGIAADKVIEPRELRGIARWMEDYEHLKGHWPFDEIDAVITKVMADGTIDAQEHRFLLDFCKEFMSWRPSLLLEKADDDLIRHGVCAAQPQIIFPERTFCFTGKSTRVTRVAFEQLVAKLGGVAQPNVTEHLHYLVVGDYGNAAWAFSCYGRKIAKAMGYRKCGHTIVIAHELDFWDAVENVGSQRPAGKESIE